MLQLYILSTSDSSGSLNVALRGCDVESSKGVTAAFLPREEVEMADLWIYLEHVGLWPAGVKVPWLLSFLLLCMLSQHRCSSTRESKCRSEHQ